MIRSTNFTNVSSHFQATAPYWDRLYSRDDLYATIYRQRHRVALEVVDSLRLVPGSRVLEVGCGPGHTSAALAQRAFDVSAIDAAAHMVERARNRIAWEGASACASATLGDVHHLGFADGAFTLVLALGVLEWLDSLAVPMREMARVLACGGFLIVSTDNRWAAHRLLDPALNPILAPVKELARGLLLRTGLMKRRPRARVHSIRQLDRSARQAGLEKLRGIGIGFGPFSLFKREALPRRAGLKLDEQLQKMASRETPVVRSLGHVYLLLARKPHQG
jgi:SAM-dependent methyltransferase